MKVIKMNGNTMDFNPSKITKRIKDQSVGLDVDADRLSISVISQMADNITTKELDNLCVETASSNVSYDYDYSTLASRLFITSLRKYTPDTFSKSVKKLSEEANMLDPIYVSFVKANATKLDSFIVQDRDFLHDIFGLRTLEKSYLMKTNKNEIIERPQYMWMRVAIEVTKMDIDRIQETYDAMSTKKYTHATPTLFNSGTEKSQLSSCFLLALKDDSIDGIYDTLKDCAKISQWAGGIGLHIHNVRATGSHIRGTNGISNGIVPMLQVFNATARYVDQGGGKRKGSFAIYLEPWHADIYELLDLKKNTGKEEMRARDLFYAMWTPDLFMKRVLENGDWSLFCPNEIYKATGIRLQELTEDDFVEAYEKLESLGIARKVVKAQDLWEKILVSQIETGTPFMGYKDKVNMASNQKNLGTIQSSNLCIEINEYSSASEQAVCNLASVGLPAFYNPDTNEFDYQEFKKTVRLGVRNLNNVIDTNYYPTVETMNSNNKHRPIGLGVQGLADLFIMMKIAFDSPAAKQLNKDIFQHMYYYALEESIQLSKEQGCYESFPGSPAASGMLQFDFWGDAELNKNLDWKGLKQDIMKYGLRNSLLLAMMPTASTSQILGYNEAFEPYTANMYNRRTLSGEFIVVNKHLLSDLKGLGLWNDEMRKDLMRENGSVQNLNVPTYIKELYKTAYELSMKAIIDMSADRQRFICQAQSMNLFMTDVSFAKLSSMHLYAWKAGLKTGMYYLRTKAAVDAIKFTVQKETQEPEPMSASEYAAMIEAAKNAGPEECLMCGS